MSVWPYMRKLNLSNSFVEISEILLFLQAMRIYQIVSVRKLMFHISFDLKASARGLFDVK